MMDMLVINRAWFLALILVADGLATAEPEGMVMIPAGNFTMGATQEDGFSVGLPVRQVYVSAFCMDKYEVTKALWDRVYTWGTNHGYGFDRNVVGKATNHPVQRVSWFNAVKWCNARSQMEGLMPVYYTDRTLTIPFTNGAANPFMRWTGGYRLPTEAEWEKAARGGASGQRFPWGDTITQTQANFRSEREAAFDLSAPPGYHQQFRDGGFPYTSPVGTFPANGYGLFDMAGNVIEWCWDWHVRPYDSKPARDPIGPDTGLDRVQRGGDWRSVATKARCAHRYYNYPAQNSDVVGFRTVRSVVLTPASPAPQGKIH